MITRIESENLPIELTQFSPEPLPLPFTVEIVEDEDTLAECIKLRSQAYGRHRQELGELFSTPEPEDFDPHFTNLVARSKVNGAVLGTVRIEARHAGMLAFEHSYRLPHAFRSDGIAEISRLSVGLKVGNSPRLMLIKAVYWFCRAKGLSRFFITARYPTERLYRRFELPDVIPNQGSVPLKHVANLPHRIMWVDIHHISEKWRNSKNPLLETIFLQSHPDILGDLQSRTIFKELFERQVVSVAQGN